MIKRRSLQSNLSHAGFTISQWLICVSVILLPSSLLSPWSKVYSNDQPFDTRRVSLNLCRLHFLYFNSISPLRMWDTAPRVTPPMDLSAAARRGGSAQRLTWRSSFSLARMGIGSPQTRVCSLLFAPSQSETHSILVAGGKLRDWTPELGARPGPAQCGAPRMRVGRVAYPEFHRRSAPRMGGLALIFVFSCEWYFL